MQVASTQTQPKLRGVTGLNWMEGRWVGRAGQRRWEEIWTRCGDTLQGHSMEMEGGETTFSEPLRIERVGSGIAYHATPGGAPVTYELTALSAGWACFENLTQAFPRRAIYQRCGQQLTLTLTGKQKGRSVEMRIEWQLEASL